MSSPTPSNDTGPTAGTPQRRPPPRSASAADIRRVVDAHSDESLKHRNGSVQPPRAASAQNSRPDVVIPRLLISHQLDYDQDQPLSGQDQRQQTTSRSDSDRTTLRPHHGQQRPEHPLQCVRDTTGTPEPKRIAPRVPKEENSPPLTGKDSAYSSVSGASFASPTVVHPRSASSQSSYPRAQFGLFPSSAPSTPMHSMSARHGAMSPALVSSRSQDQSAPQPVHQRSQSSLDSHVPTSRRLLRKSSLSSLKKLFSKKKYGSVETIVE
jgi:hypothetical protein